MARPPKYQTDYPAKARELGPVSLTEAAQFFQIDPAAVRKWCRKHPEFGASLTLISGRHGRPKPKVVLVRDYCALVSNAWPNPWRDDQRAA